MSVDTLPASDGATGDDLRQAAANINARAKRIPHVVGTPEVPTEWDRRHAELDELVTLIQLETA